MTTIYNNFKQLLLNGGVDLDTDTIKIALLNDSIAYTPDIDGELYVGDVIDGVSANEFAGTGYARQTLAVTVSVDNTTDAGVVDAADPTFTGLDGDTIAGAIVYKEVTTDADSPLIAHFTSVDFPLTANGGDVTIAWAAEGALNLN